MATDTKGKEVPYEEALKLHHKLAMNMPAETGAGKGTNGRQEPACYQAVRIEYLLQRLETAQVDLAREALQQPQDRTEFEYGRVTGLYAGLELAKAILIDTVAEKERRDFDL